MGTTLTPDGAQLDNLWKVWGGLSELCTETSIYVYGAAGISTADYADALGTQAGAGADVGAWKADSKRVERLSQKGDLGRGVVEGTFPASKWLEIAQTTWDDLAALQKSAGYTAFRFADVWGEVAVPTVETVDKKVLDTVQAAEDAVSSNFYPILILVVVGLVALAVVKVA